MMKWVGKGRGTENGGRNVFRPLTISLFLLSNLMFLLWGCSDTPLYERMDTIPEQVWQSSNRLVHEVVVTDTVQTYDFYLNIRIGADYAFSNMYMFIGTEFPDGRSVRDTVELILADRKGRWLGKGLGDIRDNRILFKPKVRFPRTGTYRFNMEQGMRKEQLDNVYDIGVSIVPHGSR